MEKNKTNTELKIKKFAIQLIQEFSREENCPLKSTIDLTPFEQWLIKKLHSGNICFSDITQNTDHPVSRVVLSSISEDILENKLKIILNRPISNYAKMVDVINFLCEHPGRYPLDLFSPINSVIDFMDYAKKKGIKFDETHFFI